jgi:putative ABC transport system permease protein
MSWTRRPRALRRGSGDSSMSTAVLLPPPETRAANGGQPVRRAVVRWAWRLFRHEWRQPSLSVALIIVAVGATILGAAVSMNTPEPASVGFGTAQDLATFQGPDPHLAPDRQPAASLRPQRRHREGDPVVPGDVNSYQLRAHNPAGPFGQPMVALLSAHYPMGPGQVAMMSGVASAFNVKIGDVWHAGDTTRRVVGIVENPRASWTSSPSSSPARSAPRPKSACSSTRRTCQRARSAHTCRPCSGRPPATP